MKGFVSKQSVVLLHQWGTGNNKITKRAGKGEIITRGNIITCIMQLVWYKILVLIMISIALKMSAKPLLFNLPVVIKHLLLFYAQTQ